MLPQQRIARCDFLRASQPPQSKLCLPQPPADIKNVAWLRSIPPKRPAPHHLADDRDINKDAPAARRVPSSEHASEPRLRPAQPAEKAVEPPTRRRLGHRQAQQKASRLAT